MFAEDLREEVLLEAMVMITDINEVFLRLHYIWFDLISSVHSNILGYRIIQVLFCVVEGEPKFSV